jgi:signal transduction histidine kinase
VLDERVRLSHELHDTLLQSLVGVALQFGAVSNSLDASPETAKAHLARARRQIEEYIRDARQSIWSLRSPMLETRDLVSALRESADRVATGRTIQIDVSVRGTPLRTAPEVEHQLLRIGQEAILNAVRHASAQAIHVTLDYGADDIALRVADDGHGFDVEKHASSQDGHYGLTTMYERAAQVGGRCTISSIPGKGTIVEARVPVSSARAQATA